MADELIENRRTEAFTEIDLTKWIDQLKELRNQLDQSYTVKIKYDDDQESSIHLRSIQLRHYEKNKRYIID